jgi:hypothetical protein
MADTAPIFTKFTRSAEGVVKRSCAGTGFHENPTNGLLSDTRLQTDKQMDGRGLHFVKNVQ